MPVTFLRLLSAPGECAPEYRCVAETPAFLPIPRHPVVPNYCTHRGWHVASSKMPTFLAPL